MLWIMGVFVNNVFPLFSCECATEWENGSRMTDFSGDQVFKRNSLCFICTSVFTG